MVGPEPLPMEETKFHHAMWIHGAADQLDWEPSLPDIAFRHTLMMLAEAGLLVNRIGTGLRIEMVGSASGELSSIRNLIYSGKFPHQTNRECCHR